MTEAGEFPPIEIRLLGSFELTVRGQPVLSVPKQVRSLLTWLVSDLSAQRSRTRLAAALWPEADEERSHFYLRRTLAELRDCLGPERARLDADLQFDLDGCWCDLREFQKWTQINPDEAISIYSGRLSVSSVVSELESLAQRLEDSYVDALFQVADRRLEIGALGDATALLRNGVALVPSNEQAWRRWMQLLADRGDFVSLSSAFRRLRAYLKHELELEPEPETTDLYHQLLGKANVVRLRSSSTATEPFRLQLPTPVTPLFGREGEIAEINRILDQERVVSVIGLGGVGKTRMALEIVENHSHAFSVDGSRWLRRSQVTQDIALALGVEELTGDQLDLPNPTLLLIDSIDDSADFVQDVVLALLANCPALKVLLTSRVMLDWPGMKSFRLLPFDTRGGSDSLSKAMKNPAIQFFVARARSGSSEFHLQVRNFETIASICRKLDGVPLAIELAAGRLRNATLAEIDRNLEEQFRFSRVMDSSMGLREIMDWSFGMLNPPERCLVHELAVFPSDWSSSSAEQICPHFSYQALEGLVGANLVAVENGRYVCLDTVRTYSRSIHGVTDELVDRFVEYFLEQGATYRKKLEQGDADGALSWFRSELPNLKEALRVPVRQGSSDTVRTVLALHNVIYGFWHRIGRMADFYQFGKKLIATSGEPSEELVEALFVAGGTANSLGLLDAASDYFDQAESMAEKLGIIRWKTESLRHRAEMLANQGKHSLAQGLLEEACERAEAAEDEQTLASCWMTLGYLYRERRDFGEAARRTADALRMFDKNGNRLGVLWCQGSLGTIYLESEEAEVACKLFEETLASCDSEDSLDFRVWIYTMLAEAKVRLQKYPEAKADVEQAIHLHGDRLEPTAIEWSISLLGEILMHLKSFDAAQLALNRAWLIHGQSGPSKLGAYTLVRQAELAVAQSQFDAARKFVLEAEAFLEYVEVEDLHDRLDQVRRKL